MIRVEKDAQKTNAYQENRNLMLSTQAHADSIPGLEILANDVRCTHGATLGQVDREQLFYLMARGLSRAEAERLIVRGFFQDVLDRIQLEPVRETLGEALERGSRRPEPAGRHRLWAVTSRSGGLRVLSSTSNSTRSRRCSRTAWPAVRPWATCGRSRMRTRVLRSRVRR